MSAESGLKASQAARSRLHEIDRSREIGQEKEIDFLIKSEKDALHAMNLHRLLTKNWAEYPNSYRIQTKLKDKDNQRLKNILQDNRYSS